MSFTLIKCFLTGCASGLFWFRKKDSKSVSFGNISSNLAPSHFAGSQGC